MHGLYLIAVVVWALFAAVGLPWIFTKAAEQREREGRDLGDDHDRAL